MKRNSIAATHERFFKSLKKSDRRALEEVAKLYGKALYKKGSIPLAKNRRRDTYHVGINVVPSQFESVTKRATLVTDTLMLSEDHSGPYVSLDSYSEHVPTMDADGQDISDHDDFHAITYGMNCSDLEGLGKWILDTEALLKKGNLFYLPAYQSSREYALTAEGNVWDNLKPSPIRPLDYLVDDKRAIVNLAGATPEKSELIRPVLTVDLPFLEATSMKDFSEITVNEFGAYENFKSLLRVKLTEMNDAANATQSDRELRKLAREVEQGIREVDAKMNASKGTRWGNLSLVGVHSIAATLFAVADLHSLKYMTIGAAAAGTTPLVANFFKSIVDDRSGKHRESAWYYVWALHERSVRSQ